MEHTETKRESLNPPVNPLRKPETKASPEQHCYFEEPEVPVPLGQGSQPHYIEVAEGKAIETGSAPTRSRPPQEGEQWPASGEPPEIVWPRGAEQLPADPSKHVRVPTDNTPPHRPEPPIRSAPHEQVRSDDEDRAAKAKVIQDEKDAEERLKKATKSPPHAK
jgi:hypothetical protein